MWKRKDMAFEYKTTGKGVGCNDLGGLRFVSLFGVVVLADATYESDSDDRYYGGLLVSRQTIHPTGAQYNVSVIYQ